MLTYHTYIWEFTYAVLMAYAYLPYHTYLHMGIYWDAWGAWGAWLMFSSNVVWGDVPRSIFCLGDQICYAGDSLLHLCFGVSVIV